jgi:phage repressor protein C with HTH and peptisase S24 domain
MTIGYRLIKVRGSMHQSEIATALQIAQATWSRYEKGERTPDAEALQKLSEMGWNVNWILTGKGSERGDGDAESKWSSYALVPRYSVTASMGGGHAIDSEQIVDYFAFRRQYLDFLGVSEKSAAVIRLRGDSMTGVLETLDTVMVDLASRTVMPPNAVLEDSIYVLRLADGNDLLAKFVAAMPNGMLRIRSSVASGLQELLQPAENVLIMGKVVWFGRSVATSLQRRFSR